MRILLDTHILLWALSDSDRLSERYRSLIIDPTNDVLASAINIAEIAIKSSIGKCTLDPSLEANDYRLLQSSIVEAGFDMLDFTAIHAARLRTLPFHHRDPFDRMIVAQAMTEGLSVLTVDNKISMYDIDTA